MVKRLITSIISMSLVAGVITPQIVYGGANTIPIQLVKQGHEDDYVENAEYDPTVSRNGIASSNIKKGAGSHYQNKVYLKTELDGKPLKSLSWLDQDLGFVKYELDGASMPDDIDVYYKSDEMTPQAKYNFEGSKATIYFNNQNEERLEIVDETGMKLLEKDVFIPTNDQMADYYFYVSTQDGMKDTDIQVKNGSGVVTPIENVSTATTKVLKYKLKVQKEQEYTISVNGTPITREAKFVFDEKAYEDKISKRCEAVYGGEPGWKTSKYDNTKPYCSVSENGNNKFTFELNIRSQNEFWSRTMNWLVGKITIAGEAVQVPAPMMVEREDLNYLKKIS